MKMERVPVSIVVAERDFYNGSERKNEWIGIRAVDGWVIDLAGWCAKNGVQSRHLKY